MRSKAFTQLKVKPTRMCNRSKFLSNLRLYNKSVELHKGIDKSIFFSEQFKYTFPRYC